jgi:hypothetical protein
MQSSVYRAGSYRDGLGGEVVRACGPLPQQLRSRRWRHSGITYLALRVYISNLEQTTASDSGLVAVVAARSRYATQNPSVRLEDMVVYTTTQTHSLGAKAALVLGLECRALEVTPEDRFSLRGETLRKALEEDRTRGKHPFILSGYSWQCPYIMALTVRDSRHCWHNILRGCRSS